MFALISNITTNRRKKKGIEKILIKPGKKLRVSTNWAQVKCVNKDWQISLSGQLRMKLLHKKPNSIIGSENSCIHRSIVYVIHSLSCFHIHYTRNFRSVEKYSLEPDFQLLVTEKLWVLLYTLRECSLFILWGGGASVYGSTFNIFKTPLRQQQNLNDPPPPRETSKLL